MPALPVYEWCDEGNGTIGATFGTALADLGPLPTGVRLPVGALVDRVSDGVCDNGYGEFDGTIALFASALGDAGLRPLKAWFEAQGQALPDHPAFQRLRTVRRSSAAREHGR